MSYDLGEIGEGALQEVFDEALTVVLKNISDPNTDQKKMRQIIVTFKFVPGSEGFVDIVFDVKSKTEGHSPLSVKAVYGDDGKNITIQEFSKNNIPGQVKIDVSNPQYPTIMENKIKTISGGKV